MKTLGAQRCYYMNTTRYLKPPASDGVIAQLMMLLNEKIAPTTGEFDGLQNIAWLLSQDRLTLQAFSGWQSAEDLPRAEHSSQHINNGKLINELLGGLASPQEHTYFQLLARRTFR